jgi:DNA gyrase subunit B
MAKSTYTAADIDVLEGLEPVRQRPAMYIGGTGKAGYHHLLWEIVDNSIDEVINGHATRVDVTLCSDGKTMSVEDNGRGIPTDIHPKHKKSAVELVFTVLHAGGKFDRGKNYAVSGGLHGVGASVVNALSSELTVTIKRDGERFEQTYQRGVPQSKLKKLGNARGSGTSVTFKPDEHIFGPKLTFDPAVIAERLEAKSYLHRGLVIVFKDETQKPAVEQTFQHEQGIAEYLPKVVGERGKAIVPPGGAVFYLQKEPSGADGLGLELALQWTESTDELVKSYVNSVPTPMGGTHDQGLKGGVVKAVRNYMSTHKLDPKGVNVLAEDIREGMVAILSLYHRDPQFQGQTKDRLNNPDVTAQVDAIVRPALESWLNQNPSWGQAVVSRLTIAARAREASRAAAQAVTRKTAVSHRLNLPGKLADCASTDPSESELFIVEGDSAGGSAKQGRDRKTQAILPLRGKVLNAEQASSSKVLNNKELQDLVQALGCGMGATYDESKLRYGRVFLLMDADSDGHHISTLLLTFFYRQMPGLIRGGHVYLAMPPLFRIDHGKEHHWALDEKERDQIVAKLPKNAKVEIARFKGLGEMNPEELKSTTLDKERRRALRVMIDSELETDKILNELMGKDTQARFRFIMERARETSAEELDV